MLEIRESHTIARQLNETVRGKVIRDVLANTSPHRFAFYFGDPAFYHDLLTGKALGDSRAIAGQVEIEAGDARLLFSDGVNIRYLPAGEQPPAKHQLLVAFEDGACLVCTVQMYGGLWAYRDGENDNPYYLVAKEKPSPLDKAFSDVYFRQLMDSVRQTLSAKAFLATEQRIPGLGNGVLQDIMFNALINPRTTIEKLAEKDKAALYQSVRQVLAEMTARGGRDTEKDLFGAPGSYETRMSARRLSHPCPGCGGTIIRQSYMGGNVYFCPTCQPLL